MNPQESTTSAPIEQVPGVRIPPHPLPNNQGLTKDCTKKCTKSKKPAAPRKAGKGQKFVDTLDLILRSFDLDPVHEYRFHPERQWRFDLAIPQLMLAIEYHGHSAFQGGKQSGHSTVIGLTNDCEKINQARVLGWTVLAFTTFHFREADRQRHKLESPAKTIEAILRNITAAEEGR